MANDIALFGGGTANIPAHLQQAFTETNIEDRQTVPSLLVTGKIWSISYEGTKTPLQRNVDGDLVPVGVMRVVVLDYAKRRGRAWYEGTYDPNSTSAPQCWSEDGVTPDPSSPKLQSDKCATCSRAIKGSKVTDSGQETYECSQHRMLAVMPVVGNKFFTRALRLKLAITGDFDKKSPDAEKEGWRAWQQYTDFLKANGVGHTAMLVTKMKFDPNAAYPKIFFGADRWLTPEEIVQVKPFTTAEDTVKLLGGSWTPAGGDGVKTEAEPTPDPVIAAHDEDDEEEGEIVMAGLTAEPDTPVQEPAQAVAPKAPKPKAEPKKAAEQAATAAPAASADIPDDVKALLAAWEPQE